MTLTQIEAAIKSLPATAAEIADFLVAAGITGVKEEGTCCPVARWLRRELEVPYARIDIEKVTVVNELGDLYETNTPSPLGRFIGQFDDDAYPDLVDLDGPTEEELAQIKMDIDGYIPEPDLMESQYV